LLNIPKVAPLCCVKS